MIIGGRWQLVAVGGRQQKTSKDKLTQKGKKMNDKNGRQGALAYSVRNAMSRFNSLMISEQTAKALAFGTRLMLIAAILCAGVLMYRGLWWLGLFLLYVNTGTAIMNIANPSRFCSPFIAMRECYLTPWRMIRRVRQHKANMEAALIQYQLEFNRHERFYLAANAKTGLWQLEYRPIDDSDKTDYGNLSFLLAQKFPPVETLKNSTLWMVESLTKMAREINDATEVCLTQRKITQN